MKDRTVMVGALTVACFSVTSGLVFGGAVGAFGSGGPIVTPPALVSTVTADSLSDFEPAAFYTSIAVPTVVIPPTPTWKVAAEVTAPRNQPLDPATTTRATVTSTPATPTVTSTVSATSSLSATSSPTSPSSTRTATPATTSPVPTVVGIPEITIEAALPTSED